MKTTMSGRRLCCPSITLNWFTASQSFARTSPKSIQGEGGEAESGAEMPLVRKEGWRAFVFEQEALAGGQEICAGCADFDG